MMTHTILTGFLYASDNGLVEVPFRIQPERGGTTYQDWSIREVTVETTIPGTNITFVEHLGCEPAVVTWALRFASRADYFLLRSLTGKVGTLVVVAGLQSLKGSTPPIHHIGVDYEHLDAVWVAGMAAQHEVGGMVEAQVTFKRAVDPVTGLAVIT